jgi:hypothetical protein
MVCALFKHSLLYLCLAVVVLPLSGCAMFNAERWNLDSYRDARAVDLDSRLSEGFGIREPGVRKTGGACTVAIDFAILSA